MSAPHIVMVDDEEDLREPVAAYLRDQGVEVEEADGGPALDRLLSARVPQVAVLDVTMPGEDGFSIARRLRASYGPRIGIIMLTARRDLVDRVVGLELGADDYMMKPFEPRELLARVRSVARRVAEPAAAAPAPEPEAKPAPANGYHDAFWVQTSRGQIRVPVDTIEWIEAAKDYALLHTGERSHMIRVTMAALAETLDPERMMRVHRSAFVRPAAVREVAQVGRHTTLVLQSGTAVRVGPIHADEVRQRLRR
ncbi:response regulator [Sphingomonas lenta]|uniref:response regulator n=1 Tax=Sphingomonas lenta TaxID=1141887 RepID=UPI0015960160|nr:response regulator [Sphingomonas lenta]